MIYIASYLVNLRCSASDICFTFVRAEEQLSRDIGELLQRYFINPVQ